MIKIFKKICKYNTIIFDLDNTLISLTKYDILVFKYLCNFLIKNRVDRNKIYKKLINLRKKEILSKKRKFIFNKFFFNKDLKVANKIYNTYFPPTFKINKTNLTILKKLKNKNKNIYLVTNGHKVRQSKKIDNLKIKNFFNNIYILDGKIKKFKPSVLSVNSLKKKIKDQKTVMIGDNKIDEQFAKNLKVKYIKYITT